MATKGAVWQCCCTFSRQRAVEVSAYAAALSHAIGTMRQLSGAIDAASAPGGRDEVRHGGRSQVPAVREVRHVRRRRCGSTLELIPCSIWHRFRPRSAGDTPHCGQRRPRREAAAPQTVSATWQRVRACRSRLVRQAGGARQVVQSRRAPLDHSHCKVLVTNREIQRLLSYKAADHNIICI
jgi:hypothetical protein